jgi:hypothetical protein
LKKYFFVKEIPFLSPSLLGFKLAEQSGYKNQGHLTLNSGAWFLPFVIADRLSLQAIHFNNSPEIARPPLRYWDKTLKPSIENSVDPGLAFILDGVSAVITYS